MSYKAYNSKFFSSPYIPAATSWARFFEPRPTVASRISSFIRRII